MEEVDELFAACDINGDGAVSKIEFLEFLREHKPKHGPWQSVAKLQAHFGLDKKPDVNKASFRAAFAAAAEKGLNPSDFEYRFRTGFERALFRSTSGMSKPVFHYWAKVASRGHYLFYTLAFHDRLDDIEHKGDQPYPGAEGWDAVLRSKVGSLPTLVDGDVAIGQSRAIFTYLCRKYGIGKDLSLTEFAASEELVETAVDVHSMLDQAQYAPDRTAAMDALFADGGGVPKVLAAFEDHVGGTVTAGHCCFAAALNLLTRLQADCLDKHPKIKAFNDTVQGNAGIKTVNERCPYPYFKRNSD